MNDELKAYVLQWRFKAEHDLMAAQTILKHKPIITDVACFHCQQAVEKFLKAYLVSKGEQNLKTHSVDFLLSRCVVFDPDFNSIEPKSIDDFAVEIRYPDNYSYPEFEEAQDYLSIAEKVRILVMQKLHMDYSPL